MWIQKPFSGSCVIREIAMQIGGRGCEFLQVASLPAVPCLPRFATASFDSRVSLDDSHPQYRKDRFEAHLQRRCRVR